MCNMFRVRFKTSSCGDQDVIHIDDNVSHGNFFSEYGVHHHLKYGRRVGEFKCHCRWGLDANSTKSKVTWPWCIEKLWSWYNTWLWSHDLLYLHRHCTHDYLNNKWIRDSVPRSRDLYTYLSIKAMYASANASAKGQYGDRLPLAGSDISSHLIAKS